MSARLSPLSLSRQNHSERKKIKILSLVFFQQTTKASMETLTLARYVLETSLLHYEYVSVMESLIAAAAFLLAIRMHNPRDGKWVCTYVIQ